MMRAPLEEAGTNLVHADDGHRHRVPAGLSGRRRRLAAALVVAVVAALLVSAGPAVAYTPNPIPLNTRNWSPNAGFGSSAPAWYVDGFGIVHQQGAVKQTSARERAPT